MEPNKPDPQLPTQQPLPQPLPQPQPPTPSQTQTQSQQQPPPSTPTTTTTQLQPQQQPQPQAIPQILQHQPQQVQAQIQPQQLIQPQLAPQIVSPQQPQQLTPSSQAVVVSASGPAPQLAQQQAAIQPACSVAPSPSVVPQHGQVTRGPTNRMRPLCCLLDNGVRCDRDAGNASFNARIQKIVGTKKMNFTLDSTVRHAYICEHHKGIITVAKKSATLVRDTKANARNCTAITNANNLVLHPHPSLDYEFSIRQQQQHQQQQQSLQQHPGSLDLSNNQTRLAGNHTSALNNIPMRHGAHLAYGHFQGSHTNQVGFDNAGGGDNMASSGGSGGGGSGIDVDLQQLQVNTLRRYKRHFRVPTRPGLNKMQLAESLKSHFRTLPIIEKEAITYFVYIVKCYRNKLDHNPKAD